jgi:hypothetical protein
LPLIDHPRQPAVDGALVDPKPRRDLRHGLALSHGLDRVLTHRIHRRAIQLAAIGFAFAISSFTTATKRRLRQYFLKG